MHKFYISAEELLLTSYQLAANILNDGFFPDFIVAVWRGGTPVGIAVQEMMAFCGIETDHIAIRTSSYAGIDQQKKEVMVHNLGYLIDHIDAHHRLLIVDDVFDSGRSISAILEHLKKFARSNTPKDIRIATPYYKPAKNVTEIEPDYCVKRIDTWLVFPHELCGLEFEEVAQNKPSVAKIIQGISMPNKT